MRLPNHQHRFAVHVPGLAQEDYIGSQSKIARAGDLLPGKVEVVFS
jgi:hypothetical protein